MPRGKYFWEYVANNIASVICVLIGSFNVLMSFLSLTLCRLNDHNNRILLMLVLFSLICTTVEWISTCLMYLYIHGTPMGLYTCLGNVTLEKCSMIVALSDHWLLLDNSMSMFEMVCGICELL